jgi:hypothetical protein
MMQPLDKHFSALARMVAETSWLPHPDTVRALGRAAFPTVRARKGHPRFSEVMENGQAVGMYDDNATPAWALLWSHGITGGNRNGWSFAHIWSACDDMNAFTHPANLALVPECFASLTDKRGPLTGYLRWHAWTVYGWKPEAEQQPEMAGDYASIQWRYLPKYSEPRQFISQRLAKLTNQRVQILRPIMEMRGML